MANPLVNGLPVGQPRHPLNEKDIAAARLNNQFLLTDSNKILKGQNIIVFLEYVDGTSFVIEDFNGVPLTGTIPSRVDWAHAPLRLDGGVELTGTIVTAKGFFIHKNNMEV